MIYHDEQKRSEESELLSIAWGEGDPQLIIETAHIPEIHVSGHREKRGRRVTETAKPALKICTKCFDTQEDSLGPTQGAAEYTVTGTEHSFLKLHDSLWQE